MAQDPSTPPASATPPSYPDNLQAFINANPEVKVERNKKDYVVRTPWGDESILLAFPLTNEKSMDILKPLRLPPKFSAIWHRDSRDVEFIYGYVTKADLTRSRIFDFTYIDRTYHCEFAPASERLNALSERTFAIQPAGESNYRNILDIRHTSDSRKKEEILTSFWIRDAALSEDELVVLARHINFYMVYYDRNTPVVILQSKPQVAIAPNVDRLPHGPFPSAIRGHQIDSYLLSLLESARNASVFQKYLHHYQILEFASFYHTREEMFTQFKKILVNPAAFADMNELCRRILDVMVQESSSDEAKQNALIERCADPTILWKDVETRREFFSKSTVFEGGLTLDALISPSDKFSDFRSNWKKTLPKTLTTLRNSLVHAREKRQSHTVHPTGENEEKVKPWLDLLSLVSMQVLVYNRE